MDPQAQDLADASLPVDHPFHPHGIGYSTRGYQPLPPQTPYEPQFTSHDAGLNSLYEQQPFTPEELQYAQGLPATNSQVGHVSTQTPVSFASIAMAQNPLLTPANVTQRARYENAGCNGGFNAFGQLPKTFTTLSRSSEVLT